MYTRAYKTVISLPPMFWVAVFLLLPYALMFTHSFWTVRDGVILHEWNAQNYAKLFQNPLYLDVLVRTMRIAGSVTLLSLLLGYPLAYYMSFHAGVRKEILYQLVIVPLWISYLVRGGRVIDVYFYGRISDLATRRDEFASIIASGGADALIKRLHDRVQSLLGG